MIFFTFQVDGLVLNGYQANVLKRCLVEASEALIQAETQLNEFDSVCGDGDCGSTLRRLADGISCHIPSIVLSRL